MVQISSQALSRHLWSVVFIFLTKLYVHMCFCACTYTYTACFFILFILCIVENQFAALIQKMHSIVPVINLSCMLDTGKLYIVHSIYCQYPIPNTLITHMQIPTYDSFNDFYFMCAVFSSVLVDMFKSQQAVFCIILCNICSQKIWHYQCKQVPGLDHSLVTLLNVLFLSEIKAVRRHNVWYLFMVCRIQYLSATFASGWEQP